MAQARLCYVGKGNAHEWPSHQTRMGHAQIGFIDHLAVVEKHIDVDGTRGFSAACGPDAALRLLDIEASDKDLAGRQWRIDPNCGIEIVRLNGAALRQGLVKAAHRQHAATLAERSDSALDLELAITKVRSEAKVGNHLHGAYFQAGDLKALFAAPLGRVPVGVVDMPVGQSGFGE